jgi:peptide/nickel transport system substrate-binding protein
MRSGGYRRGGTVAACCAAVGLVLLLAACGPAAGSASSGAPASSRGGTSATYAMQPGGIAQYPFPFMGSVQASIYDSVFNVDEFQYLLYRPLYWFGKGTKPYMNPQLSVALPPKYQRNEVIIKLKHNYRWSNGEAVDAQDVVFWMNMMKAEGANDAYFSKSGLPSDVSNVRTVGQYEVTMDITGRFSESWFSSNELSEITPMPLTWDVTSAGAKPGSGGCSAASYSSIQVDANANDANPKTSEPPPISASAKACAAVFNYLTAQSSKNAATFASSPLWSVVDGPWKIEQMDEQGNLKLVYNDKYGGPVAPHHITTFTELPFTSEQAEYNVLQDPTVGQTIDVGYLPTVDAPTPAAGALVGANPSTLPDYQLSALYLWQLSYMPYNFRNNTGQAPIFDQLYFREAFQQLVDQEGVINGPLHGYGKPTVGPVTSYPQTSYLSKTVVNQGDKWALNIQGAKTQLSENGWKLEGPSGNQIFTCVRPGTGKGDCGAGIPDGRQLKFTLIYASGIDWMQSAVRELASNASLAGIDLTLIEEPFSTVVGTAFGFQPGCAHNSCSWQLALWGSWTYSPDYLPTGDTLFEGGVFNNAGDYNVPHDNQLIKDTLQARTPTQFSTAMHNWDTYATNQLPVVYEPDQATLVETIKGLDTGVTDSAGTITPEEWHYLK